MPDFSIPSDLGSIQRVVLSETPETLRQRFVVYIQDVHADPETQRNISEIISHYRSSLGIDTVLLEGASGEADLSRLRNFPRAEIKREAASQFLDEAKLTGAEYQAIVSAKAYRLKGIEDPELYARHHAAFLQNTRVRKRNEKTLQELLSRTESQKETIFNKELLAFDRAITPSGRTSPRFISYLGRRARECGVDFGHLKQIRLFLRMQVLSALLEKPWMGAGHADRTRYEKRLLEMQKEFNAPAFWAESEELIEAIKRNLIANGKEKLLDQHSQYLALLGKLIRLEMTPEDWERFEVLSPKFARLSPWGLSLKPALEFYRLAQARDRVLARQAVRQLKGVERAFLITGGFHSPAIEAALAEAGISFVSILPRTGEHIDPRHYVDRMLTGTEPNFSKHTLTPRLLTFDPLFHETFLARANQLAAGRPGGTAAMTQPVSGFGSSARPAAGFKTMAVPVLLKNIKWWRGPSNKHIGLGKKKELEFLLHYIRDDMNLFWKAAQNRDGELPNSAMEAFRLYYGLEDGVAHSRIETAKLMGSRALPHTARRRAHLGLKLLFLVATGGPRRAYEILSRVPQEKRPRIFAQLLTELGRLQTKVLYKEALQKNQPLNRKQMDERVDRIARELNGRIARFAKEKVKGGSDGLIERLREKGAGLAEPYLSRKLPKSPYVRVIMAIAAELGMSIDELLGTEDYRVKLPALEKALRGKANAAARISYLDRYSGLSPTEREMLVRGAQSMSTRFRRQRSAFIRLQPLLKTAFLRGISPGQLIGSVETKDYEPDGEKYPSFISANGVQLELKPGGSRTPAEEAAFATLKIGVPAKLKSRLGQTLTFTPSDLITVSEIDIHAVSDSREERLKLTVDTVEQLLGAGHRYRLEINPLLIVSVRGSEDAEGARSETLSPRQQAWRGDLKPLAEFFEIRWSPETLNLAVTPLNNAVEVEIRAAFLKKQAVKRPGHAVTPQDKNKELSPSRVSVRAATKYFLPPSMRALAGFGADQDGRIIYPGRGRQYNLELDTSHPPFIWRTGSSTIGTHPFNLGDLNTWECLVELFKTYGVKIDGRDQIPANSFWLLSIIQDISVSQLLGVFRLYYVRDFLDVEILTNASSAGIAEWISLRELFDVLAGLHRMVEPTEAKRPFRLRHRAIRPAPIQISKLRDVPGNPLLPREVAVWSNPDAGFGAGHDLEVDRGFLLGELNRLDDEKLAALENTLRFGVAADLFDRLPHVASARSFLQRHPGDLEEDLRTFYPRARQYIYDNLHILNQLGILRNLDRFIFFNEPHPMAMNPQRELERHVPEHARRILGLDLPARKTLMLSFSPQNQFQISAVEMKNPHMLKPILDLIRDIRSRAPVEIPFPREKGPSYVRAEMTDALLHAGNGMYWRYRLSRLKQLLMTGVHPDLIEETGFKRDARRLRDFMIQSMSNVDRRAHFPVDGQDPRSRESGNRKYLFFPSRADTLWASQLYDYYERMLSDDETLSKLLREYLGIDFADRHPAAVAMDPDIVVGVEMKHPERMGDLIVLIERAEEEIALRHLRAEEQVWEENVKHLRQELTTLKKENPGMFGELYRTLLFGIHPAIMKVSDTDMRARFIADVAPEDRNKFATFEDGYHDYYFFFTHRRPEFDWLPNRDSSGISYGAIIPKSVELVLGMQVNSNRWFTANMLLPGPGGQAVRRPVRVARIEYLGNHEQLLNLMENIKSGFGAKDSMSEEEKERWNLRARELIGQIQSENKDARDAAASQFLKHTEGLVRSAIKKYGRDLIRRFDMEYLVTFLGVHVVDSAARFDLSRGTRAAPFVFERIKWGLEDLRREIGTTVISIDQMGEENEERAGVDINDQDLERRIEASKRGKFFSDEKLRLETLRSLVKASGGNDEKLWKIIEEAAQHPKRKAWMTAFKLFHGLEDGQFHTFESISKILFDADLARNKKGKPVSRQRIEQMVNRAVSYLSDRLEGGEITRRTRRSAKMREPVKPAISKGPSPAEDITQQVLDRFQAKITARYGTGEDFVEHVRWIFRRELNPRFFKEKFSPDAETIFFAAHMHMYYVDEYLGTETLRRDMSLIRNDYPDKLSSRLLFLSNFLGVPAAGLAREADLKEETVHAILAGEYDSLKDLSFTVVMRLALALRVSPGQLIELPYADDIQAQPLTPGPGPGPRGGTEEDKSELPSTEKISEEVPDHLHIFPPQTDSYRLAGFGAVSPSEEPASERSVEVGAKEVEIEEGVRQLDKMIRRFPISVFPESLKGFSGGDIEAIRTWFTNNEKELLPSDEILRRLWNHILAMRFYAYERKSQGVEQRKITEDWIRLLAKRWGIEESQVDALLVWFVRSDIKPWNNQISNTLLHGFLQTYLTHYAIGRPLRARKGALHKMLPSAIPAEQKLMAVIRNIERASRLFSPDFVRGRKIFKVPLKNSPYFLVMYFGAVEDPFRIVFALTDKDVEKRPLVGKFFQITVDVAGDNISIVTMKGVKGRGDVINESFPRDVGMRPGNALLYSVIVLSEAIGFEHLLGLRGEHHTTAEHGKPLDYSTLHQALGLRGKFEGGRFKDMASLLGRHHRLWSSDDVATQRIRDVQESSLDLILRGQEETSIVLRSGVRLTQYVQFSSKGFRQSEVPLDVEKAIRIAEFTVAKNFPANYGVDLDKTDEAATQLLKKPYIQTGINQLVNDALRSSDHQPVRVTIERIWSPNAEKADNSGMLKVVISQSVGTKHYWEKLSAIAKAVYKEGWSYLHDSKRRQRENTLLDRNEGLNFFADLITKHGDIAFLQFVREGVNLQTELYIKISAGFGAASIVVSNAEEAIRDGEITAEGILHLMRSEIALGTARPRNDERPRIHLVFSEMESWEEAAQFIETAFGPDAKAIFPLVEIHTAQTIRRASHLSPSASPDRLKQAVVSRLSSSAQGTAVVIDTEGAAAGNFHENVQHLFAHSDSAHVHPQLLSNAIFLSRLNGAEAIDEAVSRGLQRVEENRWRDVLTANPTAEILDQVARAKAFDVAA